MALRGNYRPQLARSSLILPSSSGWMIQSGSEIVELRSKRLARAGDLLVDLFDGSHTLGAITRESGLRFQELERLTKRLSHLHQLETAPKTGPIPKQRRPSLRNSSRARRPGERLCPLLLVGLGELGLTVLDQLLQYGRRVVYIFDLVPVENCDLAPFYRPSELGRMKVDVVWRCLDRMGQSIVQRVKSVSGDGETIAATLGHVVGSVGVVICCVDRASQLAECVSAVCDTARVPLVVAELSGTGGSVGPIRTPDGARESGGCISCASLYRAEGDPFLLLKREYLRRRFPLPVRQRPALEPWLIEMISRLALLAAFQAGDRASNSAATSRIWQLSSEPFEVAAAAVPRHYACTQCFPVRDRKSAGLRQLALREWGRHWDGPAAEPVDLLELRRRSQPLIGEAFALFRSCAPESAEQRRAVYRFCRDRGVDVRDNLVAHAFRALVERPGRHSDQAAGYSEGLDFQDGRKAEALALMEGIERLFALEHSDPGRVVAASYRTVAGCALDPATFPLYAAEQYAQRGFGLRRFDPGECIDWIWGIRISDSEPVLAPLDLVFSRRSGPRIYRANSNGAACHSSFHHAVLGGIYETIERDSLMVAWMNRLSLPVLESSRGETDAGVRRDFEALSLDLTCVDITTDLDIPVTLGVLTDKLNPDFLLVNPVASLCRQKLDRKLDREITQFCRPYLSDRRCYTNRVSASSDPASVRTFPDHLKFYQNRQKIRIARFLTSGPKRKGGVHPSGAGEPGDVQEELRVIVDLLSRRGYQVIVVNCSVPMIRELGLHVVKVLIPGLQPLHAGHHYAALGGERLYQVPRLMGLAHRDRRREELNPWPHPFW